MKISRPLQYVLLASICATIYAAWIDLTDDTVAPAGQRAPAGVGKPPSLASSSLAPDATSHAEAEVRAVDLFAAPAWRFDVMAASRGEPDRNDAHVAEPQPAPPIIEASAVWQDARGVIVVINHGQATRLACDGCNVPGSLRPGNRWNGYRLDAVKASGVTVTQLSTGRRLHLEAN
ncbi:MAG: hypothetical protein JO067_07370 [Cupriavidus sp.]|nr:hypothetical protein [Cupriavidus sp.]